MQPNQSRVSREEAGGWELDSRYRSGSILRLRSRRDFPAINCPQWQAAIEGETDYAALFGLTADGRRRARWSMKWRKISSSERSLRASARAARASRITSERFA